MLVQVDEKIRKSGERMEELLEDKALKEHVLSNNAVPFSTKLNSYLSDYKQFLKCKNAEVLFSCEERLDAEY